MDWLTKVQPGTAWAVVGLSIVVIAGLVLIVYLLKDKKIKSPLFQLGDDGKPMKDEAGNLLLAKTAMNDADAEKIAAIIKREISHDCIQRPLLGAVASMAEPLCQTVSSLADRAIASGANGLIKSGKERIDRELTNFREIQAERMVI